MKNEPIRHHYIPQFILRNFSFDGGKHVKYFDKKTKQKREEEVRDVFMAKHLYRDEINSPDNPTKIESDLAVFENEASHIIKNKFLQLSEFTLDLEEIAKLKLFFFSNGI